jgi:hypothetical protein
VTTTQLVEKSLPSRIRNRNRAGSAQSPARCQLTLIASRVHRNTHFCCGVICGHAQHIQGMPLHPSAADELTQSQPARASPTSMANRDGTGKMDNVLIKTVGAAANATYAITLFMRETTPRACLAGEAMRDRCCARFHQAANLPRLLSRIFNFRHTHPFLGGRYQIHAVDSRACISALSRPGRRVRGVGT